jgi:Leucine-rich repeat (LRR) protein
MVKLNNLVKLTVKSCPIRELPLKKGVEGESAAIELSRLEYLHLWNIKISEISFVDGVCPSLEHLDITYCNDLVEVGALPPTVIKLSLGYCPKLSLGNCPKLYNLTNLQELEIKGCGELEELPCLERFTSLKNFRAFSCYNLKRIRGLGQLTQLQYVDVIYCDALEELANLEDLMRLKRLKVYGCPKLQLGRGVEEQLRQRITAMDEQLWQAIKDSRPKQVWQRIKDLQERAQERELLRRGH